jgi:hypothetical protein
LIDLYALNVLIISPSLDSNCVTRFGLYFAKSGIGGSDADTNLKPQSLQGKCKSHNRKRDKSVSQKFC